MTQHRHRHRHHGAPGHRSLAPAAVSAVAPSVTAPSVTAPSPTAPSPTARSPTAPSLVAPSLVAPSPVGPSPVALSLVALCLAALFLAGCGDGATSTGTSAGAGRTSATGAPAPSGAGPSGSSAPSEGFLEVVRSGGFAGVRDLVRVAADGSATVRRRDGSSRDCRPAAVDVRRLQRMDLAAIAALPSPSTAVNDAFVYSVRTPQGSAAAGEGDDSGRRAELLDAAAAVVASCVTG